MALFMIIFKKSALICGIFIYIVTGIIINTIFSICPFIRFRIISHWTRMFNRFLRFILRIKIVIEGDSSVLNENGNFIISNHVSYLDGVILGSLFAVVFVSKSQVRNWPLFGWMTEVGGTIFVDRQRKNKSVDYIHQTTRMLKRKVNVLVFPEGTSTDGEKLLPFQSIHFQSPLNSKSQILPIAIKYKKINAEEISRDNRDKVCWYGQIKFHKHLLKVLQLNNIQVEVVIYPKIYLTDSQDGNHSRKSLSELSYKIILNNYPLFKSYVHAFG
jgi:1-acyl-sn-glycerol-3-phosphate acyltransferase